MCVTWLLHLMSSILDQERISAFLAQASECRRVHAESMIGDVVSLVDPTGPIPHLFFDRGAPPPGETIDRNGDGRVQACPVALDGENLKSVLAIGRRIPLDLEVATVLRNVSANLEYLPVTGLFKGEVIEMPPIDQIQRRWSIAATPESWPKSTDCTARATSRFNLCPSNDASSELCPGIMMDREKTRSNP